MLVSVVQIAPAAAAVPEPAPVRREVLEKRTANSKIYDNGDGTYSYEEYLQPVHYKPTPDAPWRDIDSSLVDTQSADGPGVTNRANKFSVFLPADSANAPVVLSSPEGTIRMKAMGRPLETPVANVAETTASPVAMDRTSRRFVGAVDGGDLLYQSTATGLKETIVLERRTGKNTFSFDVDCPALTPRIEDDGRISFVSISTGAGVFTMPAPFMEDSSTEASGAALSEEVHYELKPRGVGWRLDVVADREWLDDPARVYPVKIDPTTYYDVDPPFTAYQGDAYVSDAHTTTNYGYVTDLRVGRLDSTTGNCYTYVKPYMQQFIDQAQDYGWAVLDADLKLYCYDRYSTSGTVYIQKVNSSWSEGGITWANKPSATFMTGDEKTVYEGSWASWQVGSEVNSWVQGDTTNYGFQLYAYGGSVGWAKFRAMENGTLTPYLTVRFTAKPVVEVLCPENGIDVQGDYSAVWRYEDPKWLGGKPQSGAQVELWNKPGGTRLFLGSIETSATSMTVGPPVGDWSTTQRYFFRMRAKGEAEDGREAWSDWSDWEVFRYRPTLDTSDGKGIEGYRATESIGGGASVDLATGRLHISRTDFSGPGLAGPLGVSATYDSSITANTEGLGSGWHLNVPKLAFDDQRAPNPGFESYLPGSYDPTGWYMNLPNQITTTSAVRRTDARSAMLTWSSTTTWGNVYLASCAETDTANGLAVLPGQRIKASGWVRTNGLKVDSTKAERGAALKLKFFNESGLEPVWVTSTPFTTETTTTWIPIAVETVVPENCYRARVSAELLNARGTIYFDDIKFSDETLRFTDADGTGRTYAPSGDGTYGRDPLAGGVAFERTNIVRGVDVTRTPGAPGLDANASTDGDTTDTSYDSVDWKANGTYWLKYDLKRPRVVSEIGMRLLDTMSPDRSYTYRIETSADGISWATVVSQRTGRSWVHHSFNPVRARYVRVVALGNTYSGDKGFRVAELEVLETSIGKAPVAFDQATGKVTGFGDLGGNVVKYRYDSNSHLTSVEESVSPASGDTTRRVSLTWSAPTLIPWSTGKLMSLSWRGVSSTGTVTEESGVVVYGSSGTTHTVSAPDEDGVLVGASYHYNADNRIDRVTDSDGVASTIDYDTSGRVESVTAPGGATTTFTYAVGSSSIAVSDGVETLTRTVTFDRARGCAVTSVSVDGDDGVLTSSRSVDALGHVQSVSDPSGKTDFFLTDAHGNSVYTRETGSKETKTIYLKGRPFTFDFNVYYGGEPTSLETSAMFEADRLTSSTDVKGNVSTKTYDDSWRPLISTVAAADVAGEGAIGSREGYDEWGNSTVGDIPASTAHNLLENGTFEANPNESANGWSLTSGDEDVTWDYIGQDYAGDRCIRVAQPNEPGTLWLASDMLSVSASATYLLSAWASGAGTVKVVEYNSAGVRLRARVVIPVNTLENLDLRRVSGAYTPGTDVAKIRVELNGEDFACRFDNVRLEAANVLGEDCLLENESFERYSGTLPDKWINRTTGTATEEISTDARLEAYRSLHIEGTETTDGSGDGYATSALIPVNSGEQYTASAWLKTDKVVSSVGRGAAVNVLYYNSSGTYLTSGETSVTLSHVSGTTDWTRYVASIDITDTGSAATTPAFVALRVRSSRCSGDIYADAVTLLPGPTLPTTEYDATHTFPVSSTTLSGRVVNSQTDARGRTVSAGWSASPGGTQETLTQRQYDGLGRLRSVSTAPTSGLDITASFAYSAAGRLTTVTAPGERTTTLDYDESGRIESMTTPLGYLTSTQYDGLGRLKAIFQPHFLGDAETTATVMSYDSYGRLAAVTGHDASGTPVLTREYGYDDSSRVVAELVSGETTGTLARNYSPLGRLIGLVRSSSVGTSTEIMKYDAAAMPTYYSWSALDTSGTVENTYAKTNQWRTTRGLGTTWNLAFDSRGGLRSADSSMGTHSRDYDVAGRLTTVRTGYDDPACQEITEFEIDYDGKDRVAGIEGHSDAGLLDGSEAFAYDAAGRLSTWRGHSGGDWADYDYDAAGNLTAVDRGVLPVTFGYDVDDRLTTATVAGASTMYANDAFGRRTSETRSGETTTFSWNSAGQLAGVVSGETTATYEFGPSGTRVRKTLVSAAETTTVESLWNGSRLIAERYSDGAVYEYLYGPSGMPLQLKVTDSGSRYDYTFVVDAFGSVVGLADSDGMVVAYSYDAWGNSRGLEYSSYASASDRLMGDRQPLRYRSYYLDAETGFYYLPVRMYDPATFRFLSPDPAAPEAGDPASLNRYVYCLNDPVNMVDSSGAKAAVSMTIFYYCTTLIIYYDDGSSECISYDVSGSGQLTVRDYKITLPTEESRKAAAKAADAKGGDRYNGIESAMLAPGAQWGDGAYILSLGERAVEGGQALADAYIAAYLNSAGGRLLLAGLAALTAGTVVGTILAPAGGELVGPVAGSAGVAGGTGLLWCGAFVGVDASVHAQNFWSGEHHATAADRALRYAGHGEWYRIPGIPMPWNQ